MNVHVRSKNKPCKKLMPSRIQLKNGLALLKCFIAKVASDALCQWNQLARPVPRNRVARWYIFRPKIAILVNFEGPCNGICWYNIWPLGLFYFHLISFDIFYDRFVCGNLVYFPPFWYILRRKIWQPCLERVLFVFRAKKEILLFRETLGWIIFVRMKYAPSFMMGNSQTWGSWQFINFPPKNGEKPFFMLVTNGGKINIAFFSRSVPTWYW
jgi:hypothetical protein